tara:strand:- start:1145 stop:2098 length:954 start_codon:yes stop_codon:yes gene_type:complete
MGNNTDGFKIIVMSQYLGLIFLFFGFSLGLLYWSEGNVIMTLPLGIIVALLIFFMINHFVDEKMTMARGKWKLHTKILMFCYLVLSLPVSLIILHAINVELIEKDNLLDISKNRVEVLSEMKEVFLQEKEYKFIEWESELSAELAKYVSLNDPSSKRKLQSFPYKLDLNMVTSNNRGYLSKQWLSVMDRKFSESFDPILKEMDDISKSGYEAVNNWNRLRVNEEFNRLNQAPENYKTKIEDNFRGLTRQELTLNSVLLSPAASYLNKPLLLLEKHLNIISIMLVVLIQILIFLPFIVSPKARLGSDVDDVDDESKEL